MRDIDTEPALAQQQRMAGGGRAGRDRKKIVPRECGAGKEGRVAVTSSRQNLSDLRPR
jgi:hypothetical protein